MSNENSHTDVTQMAKDLQSCTFFMLLMSPLEVSFDTGVLPSSCPGHRQLTGNGILGSAYYPSVTTIISIQGEEFENPVTIVKMLSQVFERTLIN